MTDNETTLKLIETSREGAIFTLVLNRPPLNILNIAMLKEIGAAIKEAGASSCDFLVLKAKGKAFSAGADVGEHLPDKAGEMLYNFHGALKLLAAFEGLVVACVQGSALGGGCELALPADIVLASSEAKFGQPEIQLGVFPPAAMALLPVLCPRAAACELILTGRSIDAERARELGIVSQVFPAAEFELLSEKYLSKLKAMSHSSLKITKQALRKIHPSDFEKKLDTAEKIYVGELMKTRDGVEGCKAFLEKRKPQWKN